MAGLKIRDKNGNVQQVLCISGINTMDKRIRLYETECENRGGVIHTPLPDGYDTETFLEKLAFLELEVEITQKSYVGACDLRNKGMSMRGLCIASSGGLGYGYAVSITDSGIEWAFDPDGMWIEGTPRIRMGLL